MRNHLLTNVHTKLRVEIFSATLFCHLYLWAIDLNFPNLEIKIYEKILFINVHHLLSKSDLVKILTNLN